jgi:LPXTG-motif cell wall-anchored protein
MELKTLLGLAVMLVIVAGIVFMYIRKKRRK